MFILSLPFTGLLWLEWVHTIDFLFCWLWILFECLVAHMNVPTDSGSPWHSFVQLLAQMFETYYILFFLLFIVLICTLSQHWNKSGLMGASCCCHSWWRYWSDTLLLVTTDSCVALFFIWPQLTRWLHLKHWLWVSVCNIMIVNIQGFGQGHGN